MIQYNYQPVAPLELLNQYPTSQAGRAGVGLVNLPYRGQRREEIPTVCVHYQPSSIERQGVKHGQANRKGYWSETVVSGWGIQGWNVHTSILHLSSPSFHQVVSAQCIWVLLLFETGRESLRLCPSYSLSSLLLLARAIWALHKSSALHRE